MSRAEDFQAEDQVQAPRTPDPAPLSPIECDADWNECLDAGKERGPTSMHREQGWRDLKTAKP